MVEMRRRRDEVMERRTAVKMPRRARMIMIKWLSLKDLARCRAPRSSYTLRASCSSMRLERAVERASLGSFDVHADGFGVHEAQFRLHAEFSCW